MARVGSKCPLEPAMRCCAVDRSKLNSFDYASCSCALNNSLPKSGKSKFLEEELLSPRCTHLEVQTRSGSENAR